MLEFAQARRTMVDCQLRTFDVIDRAVLAAMNEVPRERFVPAGKEDFAYSDQTLVIAGDEAGAAAVMLAPMPMGRMIQALGIRAGDRVLEVGGGYGCAAAVLAALGATVVSLQASDDIAEAARGRLAASGFGRVTVRAGMLADGLPSDAPFDAILISGAVERRPDRLISQLQDGGRLVCPRRLKRSGSATLYVRSADNTGQRDLFDTVAPLLAGFRDEPAFVF